MRISSCHQGEIIFSEKNAFSTCQSAWRNNVIEAVVDTELHLIKQQCKPIAVKTFMNHGRFKVKLGKLELQQSVRLFFVLVLRSRMANSFDESTGS